MSRRSFSVWAFLVSWISTGVVGAQEEPSYSLTLEGPKRFSGPPASEVDLSGRYTVFIAEAGNPDGDSDDPANDPDHRGGAQGWSISIAVEGVEVEVVTDEGTDAAGLFAGGFRTMETTDRAGEGSACEGFLGAVQAYVLSFTEPITLPGVVGKAELVASIRSNLPDVGEDGFFVGGVQGWSLSLAVTEGEIEVIGATFEGTDADEHFGSGFEVTELASGDREELPCAGFRGAVSAFVHSLSHAASLPHVSESSVLRLTREATRPSELPDDEIETVVTGRIEWIDGCEGSGQPVQNAVSIDGVTVRFDCQQSALVRFVTGRLHELTAHILCDSNGDRQINVADPVYVFRTLFRGSEGFACEAAADCHRDFAVDVSDGIAMLYGLFRGGALPPLECTTIAADGVDSARPGDLRNLRRSDLFLTNRSSFPEHRPNLCREKSFRKR